MTYKKERGMGMELKIPENFFVGAAMSGPQTFLISTIKWEAM